MKVDTTDPKKLTEDEYEYLFGLVVKHKVPGWMKLRWDDEERQWELSGTRTISTVRNSAMLWSCITHFKAALDHFPEIEAGKSKPFVSCAIRVAGRTYYGIHAEHMHYAVAQAVIRVAYGDDLSRTPEGFPEVQLVPKASRTVRRIAKGVKRRRRPPQ